MTIGYDDASEIVVAGSGEAYIAPAGTTLPTSPTEALSPSTWTGLGFHSEDGVTFTVTPDIAEFRAWQARQAIRRELNQQDIQFSFSLMQFNESTLPLAYGGGTITPVSGGYKYEFPDPADGLDERAIVLDCLDGTEVHRFAFSRVNATDAVESQFHRSDAALLPITLKVLAPEGGGSPGVYLTTSDAFVTGS